MNVVERHIINKGYKQFKQIDDLAYLSKNLYNSALFYIKSVYNKTGETPNYCDVNRHFNKTKQENYIALPNNTSQQILMILDKNIKSFFALIKKYKSNKSSLNVLPKFPKYKDKTKGRNILVFTSQQFRLKNGYIYFPKMSGLTPIKTNIKKDICQVRIIPNTNCYVIEVVYDKKVKPLIQNNNKASIDLGINNLASLTFNCSKDSYIINGKPLKSINQFYNKKKALLQSPLELNHARKSSNRLNKLFYDRNNRVNDYIHKSSRKLVNLLVKYNISEIVIGYNKEWKQESKMSKRVNQSFCSIPHKRFIEQVKYKCFIKGINVITNEESYTSKCSALDKETLSYKDNYLGKRIYRGLYKSSKGILLNADINGSLNIGRKVFGDDYVNTYLADRGFVYNPFIFNN